jgi:hypothetical protein
MKNLVKALFVFAVSAFVLTSCNKEKQAVKKLEGTWTLSSQTMSEENVDCGGVATEEPTVTWDFTAYTVGDEETGQAVQTTTLSSATFRDTFNYSVNDDASELTLNVDGAAASDALVFMIDKLSNSELTVSMSDSMDILTACPDSTNLFGTYETKFVTTTATFTK